MKYPKIREKIQWTNPKYTYNSKGKNYWNDKFQGKWTDFGVYKGYIWKVRGEHIPYGYVEVALFSPENKTLSYRILKLTDISRLVSTQLTL